MADGRQPGIAATADQEFSWAKNLLTAIVKRGEMLDAGTWCLSRLGARKLFSGPINLVVSAGNDAARWVETLLKPAAYTRLA